MKSSSVINVLVLAGDLARTPAFQHILALCFLLCCSGLTQDANAPNPAPLPPVSPPPATVAVPAPAANANPGVQQLPSVVVTGKAEDLVGQAPASSTGSASAEDLLARPLMRRGELLEAVPGMIVTQHAGDGKANQYFLRGFNLDHGTDFATDVEGMPMNMRTHAHGQGYTDLNPIIPELVERLDFYKGTYDAANGDLSSAGSASFHFYDALPHNLASFEFGEHNYFRGLLADTISLDANPSAPLATDGKDAKSTDGTQSSADTGSIRRGLTMALEYHYYDGPWAVPEHAGQENIFLRYFDGNDDSHFSITFMGYHGKWTSTDQVPERAITEGLISRFGSLNPTDGGASQRYSLNILWEHKDGDVTTKANLYGFYYDLNLFSDFTYFLTDPVHGDQFNQAEKRWVVGGNVSRTWEHQTLFGKDTEYNIGFQTRDDFIDPIALYHTEARQRLSTISEDRVFESSLSLYADTTVHLTDWLRTYAGVRGDLFYLDVDANDPKNSGKEWTGMVSPKTGLILGPWHDTEFYLNWGLGFHSNDARGVMTTEDSVAHTPIQSAPALVRTDGAEFGIRTHAISNLTSTISFYYLHSDSELVYDADAGQNVPGPPSVRYGVEFSNYWRPSSWLSLDGEIALTHARFVDAPDNQNQIPQSVPLMFSGGVTVGAQGEANGWFATLRARAFGSRPLEDIDFYDRPSFLLNGSIGYRHKSWEASVECLNILNRTDNDIAYYYTSRLPGEPATGVNDVHIHPTEPRQVRFKITYRF